MAVGTHVQSLDTEVFADTVAWNGDLLACGTYQLEEKSGIRKGGVLLYRLLDNVEEETPFLLQPCLLGPSEEERGVVNGPLPLFQGKDGVGKQDGGHENSVGVLDMKWISTEPHPQLITACADGYVKHMKLTKLNDSTYSYTSASLPTSTDDLPSQTPPICLSVDIAHNSFVTSTNNGYIVLGKINNEMSVASQWKGHTHEAWMAVFGSNTDTILSGGDDCKLCVWDVRCGPGVCVVSKKHEMGVVSISVNPDNPTQFASGSYNEVLSLWDQRNMKRAIQELSAGGGVWRIKWNTSHPNLVALACMHGGFKIADINKNEVVCSYDGHKSLAYGIDWYQHGAVGTGTRPHLWNGLLASCSFYDHSLQLWTLPIDLNNYCQNQ